MLANTQPFDTRSEIFYEITNSRPSRVTANKEGPASRFVYWRKCRRFRWRFWSRSESGGYAKLRQLWSYWACSYLSPRAARTLKSVIRSEYLFEGGIFVELSFRQASIPVFPESLRKTACSGYKVFENSPLEITFLTGNARNKKVNRQDGFIIIF